MANNKNNEFNNYDDIVDIEELSTIDDIEKIINEKKQTETQNNNSDINQKGINITFDNDSETHLDVSSMNESFKPDTLVEEDITFGEEISSTTKKRRRWYGIPLGIFLILFSCIGIYYSASLIGSYIYSVATDDSEERAFDEFIATVVMLDPTPFESLDGADKLMILRSAVWKTVISDISGENNQYDEYARLIIDAEKINTNAALLFGPNCILSPVNIDTQTNAIATESSALEYVITYNQETNSYHVPLLATIGSYQPHVENIKYKDDEIILTVSYVTTISSDFSPVNSNTEDTISIVKQMEYVLKNDTENNLKYITAIRDIE